MSITNIIKNKVKCICGKQGANECIFKVCKKCCNNKCCKKHNTDIIEIKQKECIYCNKHTTFNINGIYACTECYKINMRLLDNIIEPNIMFELGEIFLCKCSNLVSNDCIFKSCRECCLSSRCIRHNKEVEYIGKYCCSICNKVTNKLNTYKIKLTGQIVNYCKKCYTNHREYINNLIYNAIVNKNVKFKIEMIASMAEKEVHIMKQTILYKINTELDKHEILTYKMLLQLKKIVNTKQPDIIAEVNMKLYEKKYQCPTCNIIKPYYDMGVCKKCKKTVCLASCIEHKFEQCLIRNCISCEYGHCGNNKMEKYCKDCFEDPCRDFYNKYKNKMLTTQILSTENINIDEFSLTNYYLNFKCSICKEITDFNNILIGKCNECNKYVCSSCGVDEYINCNRLFCPFCILKNCENAQILFHCNECILSAIINDDNSANDSDTLFTNTDDEEETEKIKRCNSPVELAENKIDECGICYMNKKKYACVPCGHLCMCGECANKVEKKCPMCNIEITDIIKIFT